MHRVIGGTTSRMQPNNCVHYRPRVDHKPNRQVLIASTRRTQGCFDSRVGQQTSDLFAWIDKARAGELDTHHFQQHLI